MNLITDNICQHLEKIDKYTQEKLGNINRGDITHKSVSEYICTRRAVKQETNSIARSHPLSSIFLYNPDLVTAI